MSGKVYGIDLGTTYSCIAGFDEFGKVVVYENDIMETTTPSVVWFEGRNATVGSVAKEQAESDPGSVVSAVKRLMGSDEKVVRSGKTLRPEMVSALILKKLVKDAAQHGQDVRRAVITCPAYFGAAEREATKMAGELAGLEVLSIVNEPSAAAFSYGIEKGSLQGKAALVFDLGGGTFDATVVRIGSRDIEVIATGGDSYLGGQDWDETVGRYFIERFCDETGFDRGSADADEAFLAFAKSLAEKNKRILSGMSKVKVSFERHGRRCSFEFTRDDFDARTSGLLQNAVLATKRVLDDAESKDPSFSRTNMEILMVGGSTFMPQVAEALRAEFGIEPKSYRPNESVARGAALYARQLAIAGRIESAGGNPDDLFLGGDDALSGVADLFLGAGTDEDLFLSGAKDGFRKLSNVVSKSFGVRYFDSEEDRRGYVKNVIPKNTPLPFKPGNGLGESVCYTLSYNQTVTRFQIYENEDASMEKRIDLDLCSNVCEMKLTGLPPGRPAGQKCIVCMELDAEGILHAWGVECATGKRCDVEKKTANILSREEAGDAKSVVDWFVVQ